MSINIQNKSLIKSFDKSKFNFDEIFSDYLLNSKEEKLSEIHTNLNSKYIPKNVVKEFQDQNPLFISFSMELTLVIANLHPQMRVFF